MRTRKKITTTLLYVMCTVIFFGILLYFTTISGKNIHNNKNVENENPKQIRLHYNNAMDSRSIMCSFGNGRLGNQLSEFATLFAIEKSTYIIHYTLAKQAHILFYYFKMEPLMPYIKILETEHPHFEEYWWFDPFPNKDNFRFLKDYSNMEIFRQYANTYTIAMGQYDNDIKMFYPYINEMREMFKFRHKFISGAKDSLNGIRQDFEKSKKSSNNNLEIMYTSIHCRRTDYTAQLEIFYNSTYMDVRTYYETAIKYIKSKYQQKEHLIYVITDDADWAKNEFKDKDWYFLPNDHGLTFDQHNYWITGPDIGHDLAMLSLANISVLTYGTFGLWGAFLGNVEEIIVSQHMFKETKEGYELKEANLSNVVVL